MHKNVILIFFSPALPMPLIIVSTASICTANITIASTSGGIVADISKIPDDCATVGGGATVVTGGGSVLSRGLGSDAPQHLLVNNEVLDESKCAKVCLHTGRVNAVCISQSGFWAFTVGLDGAVFMLALSSR